MAMRNIIHRSFIITQWLQVSMNLLEWKNYVFQHKHKL